MLILALVDRQAAQPDFAAQLTKAAIMSEESR
jgi:hypothetical protein